MASPRLVTLGDGVAEATVAPDLGGGLASYDLVGAAGRAALFRPCRDLSRAGLFDLANNLLVPWSNRISGGGFHFRGRFHRLEPNVDGEPYPIHGSGFSSAWSVSNASAEKLELSLRSNGPGPFCYEARATYALDAGALNMWLWVRNVGTETLPFGLGFHPWLVRTPDTLLQAKAKRVVLENSDHLPDGEAPVVSRVEWDFAAPHALPADWINNAFLGWDGRGWPWLTPLYSRRSREARPAVPRKHKRAGKELRLDLAEVEARAHDAGTSLRRAELIVQPRQQILPRPRPSRASTAAPKIRAGRAPSRGVTA
jgi:aldose 1-epimerase